MLSLFFILCIGLANADEWWKTGSLYQIYPLSFMDSNGDGVGDIKGIISKVDYFKDIQVDAVWLSPIMKSPFQDNGYDISDFREINPRFGTIDDVTEMVKQFHDRNIKVLLDFVPNHTSDQHVWFQNSINKVNGTEDYYVWVSPKSYQVQNLPPNNWKTLFNGGKGSAWKYNEKRNQFYLHQFGDFQPDLNYKNQKVIEEMKDILRFWLGKGIDGFRVDAVPFLAEAYVGLDEPFIPGCDDINKYSCYQHIYTMNQNRTYDVIKQFQSVMEEASSDGNQKVIFLEAYTDLNNTMKFYNTRTFPFNFGMLSLQMDSNGIDFAKAINTWMDNKPKDLPANWVIGNHDNVRVGTKFGPDMIDTMNMLVNLLPGASVTYYGEEIGMLNSDIKNINDTNDVVSRDAERTPFQWNTQPNAGFSNATNTWLPVNPNYYEINVETENNKTNSHLNVYKQLKNLRKTLEATEWKKATNISKWGLSIRRGNYFILINLNNQIEELDLTLLKLDQSPIGKLKWATPQNVMAVDSDIDFSKKLKLQPKSGVVVQISGASGVFSSIILLFACLSTLLLK